MGEGQALKGCKGRLFARCWVVCRLSDRMQGAVLVNKWGNGSGGMEKKEVRRGLTKRGTKERQGWPFLLVHQAGL